MKIFIKPNSIRAKYAAKFMKEKSIAIVFGSTIHLWNCSRQDFLNNTQWLRHETAHVHQFKKIGIPRFYFLYLFEYFKNGYQNNKFEVEAREKEKDQEILSNIDFL